ncbi:11358_t:CDS:1, partial [Paraglomus brasilianum]
AIQARDEVIARNKENQHQHQMIARRLPSVFRFYIRLLHNKALLNHPRHKMKLPFHHKHRRRNNGWPNEIGKVKMDSKLIYERKLGYWTYV